MIKGRVKIFAREMTGSFFTTMTAFLVIVAASGLTVTFYSISSSAKTYVKNKFGRSISPDIIRVTAPEKDSQSISILSIFSDSSGGFSEKKFQQIKSIHGAGKVEGLLSVNIPSSAGISILSLNYRTDLILAGAPASMLGKNERALKKLWKHKNPEDPGIPMIVPGVLINTYNNGLAAANGMPKISVSMIKQLPISLALGYSSVKRLDDYFTTSGTVIGSSNEISIMGLVIPIDTAKKINRLFNRENRYLYADITPSEHKDTERIKQKIKKIGLVASTGTVISRKILELMGKTDIFTASLMIIIISLAAVAVALCCITSLWNRIEYYRTLRILGASRFLISGTVVIKFSLMGFAAGALSLALTKAVVFRIIPHGLLQGLSLISGTGGNTTIFLILTALIPAVSTLPGIIRIFYLEMNRN